MTRTYLRKWTKTYRETGGEQHRITVIADICHYEPNPRPHFSITGCLERKAGNGRYVLVTAGAIHEDILSEFPELKPLVDMHLADDDGVPMHAYANAAYWAGATKWQLLNLPTLAKHLRVSEDMADEMVRMVGNLREVTGSDATEGWRRLCEMESMPELWLEQANAAKAMMSEVN